MPCRSAAPGRGDAVAERGQPADDGRARPARARVRGDPDRLVDHDDVVVGVQHGAGPRPPRARPRWCPAARGSGSVDLQPGARGEPVGLAGGPPVQRDRARPRRASATTVRDRPSRRASPASTRMPSRPSGTGSWRTSGTDRRSCGRGRGCRRARGRAARARTSSTPPQAIAESATLNTGEPRRRARTATPCRRRGPAAGRARGRCGRSGCRAPRRAPARARWPSRWSAAAGPCARSRPPRRSRPARGSR